MSITLKFGDVGSASEMPFGTLQADIKEGMVDMTLRQIAEQLKKQIAKEKACDIELMKIEFSYKINKQWEG